MGIYPHVNNRTDGQFSSMIYLWNHGDFHGYVTLPEGTSCKKKQMAGYWN